MEARRPRRGAAASVGGTGIPGTYERIGMGKKTSQCGTSCCGSDKSPLAPSEVTKVLRQGDAVPVVQDRLTFSDRLGGWKVRMGIGRSRYRVAPGLYAIGAPDSSSPVLVTANYKLTFDSLRIGKMSCHLIAQLAGGASCGLSDK